MKAVSWAGCDGCQQGAALETESLMSLRFDTNVLAGTDTVKASFETAPNPSGIHRGMKTRIFYCLHACKDPECLSLCVTDDTYAA